MKIKTRITLENLSQCRFPDNFKGPDTSVKKLLQNYLNSIKDFRELFYFCVKIKLNLKKMLQKTFGILASLMIIVSCNSQPGNNDQVAADNQSVNVQISEILSDPLDYDNKTVKVEGIISHVCRHSGDKMRIMQDESDLSILVMLGDFTGQFDAESEGTRVSITGNLVTEVTNMEELAAHGHEEDGHDCEDTREAVEVMKARGLDASIGTYISLNQYDTK